MDVLFITVIQALCYVCSGVIDFLSEMKKCDVCGYRGIASSFVRGEGDEVDTVKCPTCGSEQAAAAPRSLSPEMDNIIQKLFSVPGYKRHKRSKANRLGFLFTDKRKDGDA
jgi:hypothetical protein